MGGYGELFVCLRKDVFPPIRSFGPRSSFLSLNSGAEAGCIRRKRAADVVVDSCRPIFFSTFA